MDNNKSETKSIVTSKRYVNKVCLVTGSSMGIGFAIAERFGLEGASIVICSRNQANLKPAEDQLKGQGIDYLSVVCNVNARDDRAKLFMKIKEKYGRLDVLVCNVAANPYFGAAVEIGEKLYDKIFEVNVKNTFFTVKEALPLLKVGKSPNALIISSYAGYAPIPMLGVYSMSKTVLLSMTKVLAQELAKIPIRVNCLAPGVISTKFSQSISDSEEAKANFLRRTGMPAEVSGAAGYICSEEASFVTGETLLITGGLYGRL